MSSEFNAMIAGLQPALEAVGQPIGQHALEAEARLNETSAVESFRIGEAVAGFKVGVVSRNVLRRVPVVAHARCQREAVVVEA